MADRKYPFDPQEVETQVDQLLSSSGETYETSSPDRLFLHDLRLVLSAEENDAQSAADDHFLESAWARIVAAGHLSRHTTQGASPFAQQRRFIVMSTLPSTPDQQVARRGSFKRLLTTLTAAIVALALVGTLAIFAMTSHTQQPSRSTAGSHQNQSRQNANDYVYHQAGLQPVFSLQWSADGSRIFSANENVTAWDAFSGSHEVKFTGYSSAPMPQTLSTQLSPDGKTLAVWNIGQIDLYDAATGKHTATLPYPFAQTPGVKLNHPDLSPYLSWSSDSKSIRALAGFPAANGSRTNKLVIFDVATGTHSDLSLRLTGLLDHIAWSPNGKYVAVGRPSEGIVSVIDIASGTIVKSLQEGAPIETIPVTWSPDSSKLVADFGNNSGLYVWDAVTGNGVVVYQGGTEPSWSPNGKYIATINGTLINILNASTGKLVHTYTDPTSSGYAVVAWAPDSSALAAGGRSADGKGGMVNVWKITF